MHHLSNLIHEDYLIQRWANGVKFVRPQKKNDPTLAGNSFRNIYDLPMTVHILSDDNSIIHSNTKMIELSGFCSLKNAIGKNIKKVITKVTADKIFHHNKQVIANNNIFLLEEAITRLDGFELTALSLKFPWYDDQKNILGVFGLSITPQIENLTATDLFSLLSKTQLLSLPSPESYTTLLPGTVLTEGYFNARETEIMKLLVRGKTAKGIADVLLLSRRTIEHYIENMRQKLCVKSKAELIDKIFDYFTH